MDGTCSVVCVTGVERCIGAIGRKEKGAFLALPLPPSPLPLCSVLYEKRTLEFGLYDSHS